jgi:hypothetical protein
MIAARTLPESAERPLSGKQLSVSIVRNWPPADRLAPPNLPFSATNTSQVPWWVAIADWLRSTPAVTEAAAQSSTQAVAL